MDMFVLMVFPHRCYSHVLLVQQETKQVEIRSPHPHKLTKGDQQWSFWRSNSVRFFSKKTLSDERNAPRCPQWWFLCVCTSQHRGQRGDLVDLHRFTIRSSKIAMENLQIHGGLVRWGNQRTKWKTFHCHGADLRRLVGRSDLVSTHPIIWASGIENMENSWKH